MIRSLGTLQKYAEIIVFSVCIGLLTVTQAESIEIGDDFPSFYLKDINGNNFFLTRLCR